MGNLVLFVPADLPEVATWQACMRAPSKGCVVKSAQPACSGWHCGLRLFAHSHSREHIAEVAAAPFDTRYRHALWALIPHVHIAARSSASHPAQSAGEQFMMTLSSDSILRTSSPRSEHRCAAFVCLA